MPLYLTLPDTAVSLLPESAARAAISRNEIFARDVAPILMKKKRYVLNEDLQKLKISLKYLNLKTGDIGHEASTARLEPMPATTIQQILDDDDFEEPSEVEHTDLRCRGDEPWEQEGRDDPETRFYQAQALHRIAATYLSSWEIQTRVKWRQGRVETTYMQREDCGAQIRYQIQTVCEAFKEYRVLNAERPFVVGYQVDQNRLVEGELLASELNALIVLAIKYDMNPFYLECEDFIVTVVTGCDRQVRVAQSRINLANNTFDTERSEIMLEPKHRECRDRLYKKIVTPILEANDPYISERLLEHLRIRWVSLDLATGQTASQTPGTKLRPTPFSTVQHGLRKHGITEPSVEDTTELYVRGDDSDDSEESEDEDDKDNPLERYAEAVAVCEQAEDYLYRAAILRPSGWTSYPPYPANLDRLQDQFNIGYQMQCIFRTRKEGQLPDASRPHIAGYQTDQNPPLEDRLLTSELNALLVLAMKMGAKRPYEECDEFVVTVATGCDRLVRISQSCVNLRENTFDLRLSRILDFENGFKENWEDWTTLLGWFAAVPAAQHEASEGQTDG